MYNLDQKFTVTMRFFWQVSEGICFVHVRGHLKKSNRDKFILALIH